MDKHLGRLIDKSTPKLNPILANGLAVEHMRHVEKYIDDVFKAAARGFPEGLQYTGCSRCTPQEEFDQLTKLKNNKKQFDVARSDLYMMKYHFRYKGVEIEPARYISLPFVGDAGTITLGGSRFNISPILSDRVISVGVANIFVRLLKARLTFERMGHRYMVDGKPETVQVAWSVIYNKNSRLKKLRATVKAHCTLMHYLLCKYGFSDTFLKYGNCKPVVGRAEINPNNFPEDEWVICTSANVKPRGITRGTYWEPSNIRVAVKRDELTPMVKNMIGGFFYVVDHFPTRVLPEYVDDTRLWKILMGHIIFTGNYGDGKLLIDIGDHMQSLDDYIDTLVLQDLKEIGINIGDVYDLFGIIVEHFNDWLLAANDKVASMYDKKLAILYYVLYEITSAIFKMYFKLKAASKQKELSAKEIVNTMNMTLKTGLIYSITKNHGEVSTISVPGDNKAFKITSLLIPQSSSNRQGNRKDRAVLSDPAKRLHASIPEIGGYLNLPKSEPSGRSRLNQHAQIDDKGVIMRNPEFVELLDWIQELIRRS